MKRAFTLIELLIVMGIIAILAGVLMGNYSGILARVKSAKCQSNLKNLANAVGVYSMNGHYPYAESAQYVRTSGGLDNEGVEICEFKGWVSWDSRGRRFPIQGNSPASLTHVSYANSDRETITYAITNGALWKAVGCNRDCYVCPVHVEACRAQGVLSPGWSYQMNAYFGFETTPGKADATDDSKIEFGSLSRADRRLLFAEIPALDSSSKTGRKAGSSLPSVNLTGSDGDPAMCGCLLTRNVVQGSGRSADANASIGFNHVQGRKIVGHVAFADGHVESLTLPQNGNFKDLTEWLCDGLDIVTKNGEYQKINESEVAE